jgi:hypothetical protein
LFGRRKPAKLASLAAGQLRISGKFSASYRQKIDNHISLLVDSICGINESVTFSLELIESFIIMVKVADISLK